MKLKDVLGDSLSPSPEVPLTVGIPPPQLTWPCSHCGQPATVDDVCLSLDGERTLTLWRCDRCQVVAATPDAIKAPPMWFKRVTQ